MMFNVTLGHTSGWIFKKQWYKVHTLVQSKGASCWVDIEFDPKNPKTKFICLNDKTKAFFNDTFSWFAFDCILHSVDWHVLLDDDELHEGEILQFNPRCHAVEPICGMTSKYFDNY